MRYIRLRKTKKIQIISILLILFTSCTNVTENTIASQTNQNVELSELDDSERKKELQAVSEFGNLLEDEKESQENFLLGNDDFTIFKSNDLTLLYPREWTLHDRMNTSVILDETVISEYEIVDLNIEKDYPFFVRVRINDNSMADGDFEQVFEQRKERLNQFLAPSSNFEDIVFEDIIINNDLFYKVKIPIVDGRIETILTTVKNNKQYDVFAQYNSMNEEDSTVIENIFNSIKILQID